MSLSLIPNISNPCMKRTMLVGPKKFVGKVPNSQVHQHTNKKLNYTDFDTLSMINSTAKTGSGLTNVGVNSRGMRSRLSTASAMRR